MNEKINADTYKNTLIKRRAELRVKQNALLPRIAAGEQDASTQYSTNSLKIDSISNQLNGAWSAKDRKANNAAASYPQHASIR